MKKFHFSFLAIAILLNLLTTSLQAQQRGGNGSGSTTNTGSNRQVTKGGTNNKSDAKTESKPVPAKSKSGTSSNTNKTTNTGNKSTTNQPNNQTNNPPTKSKGRLFWGGGVNTTTDGKSVIIDAQPFIGYRVSPKMQVTAGPVYQFQSGNNLSIYGARVASRYDIFAGAFAAGMFEYMNYNQNDQNRSLVRLPLGLGYNHSLFGIGANVSVMYDVLYKANSGSPYGTPFIISGGITLGNGGSGFNFGSKNFNINDAFNTNTPPPPPPAGNTNSKAGSTSNKKSSDSKKTNTNTNNRTRVPAKKKDN